MLHSLADPCSKPVQLRLVSSPLTRAQKLAVVPVSDLQGHLRISHNDENGFLEDLIETAYNRMTGADGFLVGCSLLHERYECFLGSSVRDCVELPMRPVASDPAPVIQMVQGDGTYSAVVGNALEIAEGDIFSEVRRVSGRLWPYTGASNPRAYRIEFTAGFGATRDTIPMELRMAIRMLAGHWYANREAVGKIGEQIAFGLRFLVGKHMVHRDHS